MWRGSTRRRSFQVGDRFRVMHDFPFYRMPSASWGWLWCGEVTNYFVISTLQKSTFFVPYVVKLAHFAAIHLKGSPFTVQNGQSFLIFGDSSSVTSHNYIATLVHCLQLPPQVHQNYKTFAQRWAWHVHHCEAISQSCEQSRKTRAIFSNNREFSPKSSHVLLSTCWPSVNPQWCNIVKELYFHFKSNALIW